MQSKFKTACLMAGALLAVPGVANAETTELEQMRAEMAQMRAEMAQLKADGQSDWTSEARRAEIEGMIADVFADANNRATLLQEGALAGIDEKGKIFLLSADGSFSANFNGQIQFRYILNNQDQRADETQSGFQMRRAKFGVKGKVGNGWGYALKFAGSRSGGTVTVDSAAITYKASDNLSLKFGSGTKLPFARQELISSSRQVGVDRGIATEFFTIDKSDMIQATYKAGDIVLTGAISDGAKNAGTDYTTDSVNDFAVTGRIDWMAIGDNWKASKNEFGGVDEDALFIGAAAHYEKAGGSATDPDSSFAWTVDALYKTGALGLTAAIFGNHTDTDGGTDVDQFGGYAQASYDLGNDWDVFGRWEYIDDDDNGGAKEEVQAVTFGVNKHFNKNVKFTGDVVYVYAGDNPSNAGVAKGDHDSSGIGLGGGFNDDEDTIALRLQLQLLF